MPRSNAELHPSHVTPQAALGAVTARMNAWTGEPEGTWSQVQAAETLLRALRRRHYDTVRREVEMRAKGVGHAAE